MEYAQRIGARIARLRTEKHLTQGQLAQAAGVPRDALARWEAGGGLPGRAELTALARPLGTTAAALLNADEDEPDEAPVGFPYISAYRAGMARPSPLYARQRAAHGLCAGGAVLYRLRCFEPRLAVRLRAYGLHRLFSGRGCILSVGLCGRPAAAAAAGRLQRRFCGRSGSRIPHPLPLASKRRALPAGARRLDGCLGTARRVRASMGRPSPLCPP